MKPFNLEAAKNGAKVVTRDGIKLRIICFDSKVNGCPLVVLISDNNGMEVVASYDNHGKFCHSHADTPSSSDLFMAPVKKECWINFYGVDECESNTYTTRESADSSATSERISCIHHTWEEQLMNYRTLGDVLENEFLGVQVIMAKYYGVTRQVIRLWLAADYLVDEHLNVLKCIGRGKEDYDE